MTAVRVNDIDRGSIVAAYINGYRRRQILAAFEYTASQIDYILYSMFESLVPASITNMKDTNGESKRASNKQSKGSEDPVPGHDQW